MFTPDEGLPAERVLDDSRPVGRCFVSTRNLENFSEMMPCGTDNNFTFIYHDVPFSQYLAEFSFTHDGNIN